MCSVFGGLDKSPPNKRVWCEVCVGQWQRARLWDFDSYIPMHRVNSNGYPPSHSPLLNKHGFSTFLTKLVMCLPLLYIFSLPSFVYLQVCEKEFPYVYMYPTIKRQKELITSFYIGGGWDILFNCLEFTYPLGEEDKKKRKSCFFLYYFWCLIFK